MSVRVQQMRHGKRIQADGEIMYIEVEEWDKLYLERKRINDELEMLKKQLNERMSLIRNAKKNGLVRGDGSLDYEKFVVYDSVNRGMSLTEAKSRVFESNPQKDEKSITYEYNRYTVYKAVTHGWTEDRIINHLRERGSSIEMGVVAKYVEQFKRKRGQS